MTHTEACFLSLLRSGLWREPADVSVFHEKGADWEAIYRMAREQAVVALAFDGMETLPADLRPPKNLLLKWYAAVLQVEQANVRLDRCLADVLLFYRQHGLYPVLLKGQGLATLYAKPAHRQCGDIDLYLGDGYARAKKLLSAQGVEVGEECEKHVGYSWNGVEVENHRYAACFYAPLCNRRFQRWTKRWLDEGGEKTVLHQTEVLLPSPGFNAIYLLVHILLHFLPEGIGLRQICDWAIVLRSCSGRIDLERLRKEVRELRLEEAFKGFGYVAVNYLGLPAACVPFSVSGEKETEATGEFLIRDVLEGGNFGHARVDRRDLPEGKWKKIWFNYRRIRKRCGGMMLFCRSEARWYPYFRALNWLGKKLRGLD